MKRLIGNIVLVLISGIVLYMVLFTLNKQDLARGIAFDNCYNTFYDNNMPSVKYESFMINCMESK